MKPVLLTMSAFGSYASETQIDFRKMDHGIFLVTGDTGAGKTTIFDAITYALYDRASGPARDGSMMRSQYAALDVPTYVELIFSYRGENYRIRRNPEYERLSQRRDKDGNYRRTKEKAQVQLFLPDGEEFCGSKREINEKIQEIVGLDFRQFTQISMIAQGEFLKLLHARSEERKEIFSRIFDTKFYGQVQEELKQQEKDLYGELKDLEKVCDLHLGEILCRKAEHQAQLEEIQRERKIPEGIRLLEQLLEETLLEKQKCRERAGQIQKQWELASEGTQVWEQEKKALRELEEIRGWLEREEPLARENREKLHAFRKQAEEEEGQLTRQIQSLEEDLKKYEKLEELRAKKEQTQSERKGFVQNLEQFRRKIQSRREEEQKLAEEQETLKEAPVMALQAAQAVREREERQQLFQKLGQIYEQAVKERRILAAAREKLQRCQEEFQEKDSRYNRLTEEFLREQAGILAARLEEGIPCPVCGSLEHPCKAVLSDQALDQKLVEKAREDRNAAEGKRNQAMESWQDCQHSSRLQEELWKDHLNKLPEAEKDYLSSGESPREWIRRKQKETEQETRQAREDADRRREQEERLRKIQKEREQLLVRKEQEKAQEEMLEQNCRESEKKILLLEKEEAMLREGMKGSPQETRERCHQARRRQEQIRRELQKKQEDQETQDRKIYENQGRKKTREEICLESRGRWEKADRRYRELTGNSLVREEVSRIRERLEKEREELQEQLMELHHEEEKNRQIREALLQCAKEYENQGREYALIRNLSRTANGSLTQSSRLDFESYVQRQYFEQIVDYANQRLIQMSSGQFLLQCRRLEDLKNQGKVGLDLDVYSLATDSVRDVKSLSGGESFMAALCMALGLADVVQNTAGAIRLETMFIDEGFGALDDASREQAVRILQELAGDQKMIGIISHVTELKEQISPRLTVEKTPKGSRAYWM